MNFNALIQQARTSSFGMWKLNFLLLRFIPFNHPHRIKIVELEDHRVQTLLPYRKSNLNHLKGLHACALATAAEYASGLLLLTRLGAKNYRIIMESIEVKYHYQGKSDATATFELSEEELENGIKKRLESEDAILHRCEIPVKDKEENLLCTVYTNWQIKRWDKVKTKT